MRYIYIYIYYPGPHLTAASLFTWNPELFPTKPSHPQIVSLSIAFHCPGRRGVALLSLCCAGLMWHSKHSPEQSCSESLCSALGRTGSSLCPSCSSAGHKTPLNRSCLVVGSKFTGMSFFSAISGGLSLASTPRTCTKHQLCSGIPEICSTSLLTLPNQVHID